MKTFLEAIQPKDIGVVGYSSGNFDKKKAQELVYGALERLYKKFGGNIRVVSGLTNLGIPALAYKFAQEHNLKTVGIACARAAEFECFPVDKEVVVGRDWGDESSTFLNSIDYLIRVGGGDQSFDEVKKFKKMFGDENVEEYELARTK